jgi:hypothetical protein
MAFYAERGIQKEDPLYQELLDRLVEAERTIVGLKNELIRAGKYQHEDAEKRVDGIQILLQKAGEYQGRSRKRR